jgi:hypothetical protein
MSLAPTSDDVAENVYLDKMEVGITNRPRNQCIFVTPSENGKTRLDSYIPDTDYDTNTPISFIPTQEETEHKISLMKFVQVGFVLAEDPDEFKETVVTKTLADVKAKDVAKEVIHPTREHKLRAIVPVTQFIKPSATQFFVAVNQVGGLCEMRKCSQDQVFFFQEVKNTPPFTSLSRVVKLNRSDRSKVLNAACRYMAAEQKIDLPVNEITLAKKKAQANEKLALEGLSVTRSESLAATITQQLSLWPHTNKDNVIKAMLNAIHEHKPDLEIEGHPATTDGVNRFFNAFDEVESDDAFCIADAEDLIRQVEVVHHLKVIWKNYG